MLDKVTYFRARLLSLGRPVKGLIFLRCLLHTFFRL